MTRLKIGIVGCGAIAQIQYLPLLREMSDDFEIAALSDLSPGVMDILGAEYAVPAGRRFVNYRDLAQSDVDAVIVCNSGSHSGPSIAAANAGKHALVEKPICTAVAEAEAMVSAAEKTGVILMVGYMKRHDPAYRYARARVQAMTDVRFVQVNHLHPDNRLHLSQFKVHRVDDLAPGARETAAAEEARLIAEALGRPEPVPPAIHRAFWWILNSMIHDLGNLSGLFGPPARVTHTELWREGNCISTTLEYPGDRRAVASWIDLPDLPTFEETLEVYGSRERVIVRFPTGFSIGLPSTVTLHGMDGDRKPWRKELSWNENPFRLQLHHLRDCVLNDRRPITDGLDAVADIALVRDIVLAAM